MIQKLSIVFLFIFLISCSNVNFVYEKNNNLTNPIYNKTFYNFSGKEITSAYRYADIYFGSSENSEYELDIKIEEKKIKRSVQSNQAIAKLDYELSFFYNLRNVDKKCLVYNKNIISNFSYVPKSSGYNFGSDQSLIKMYDLAAKENMGKFSVFLSEVDINSCI